MGPKKKVQLGEICIYAEHENLYSNGEWYSTVIAGCTSPRHPDCQNIEKPGLYPCCKEKCPYILEDEA